MHDIMKRMKTRREELNMSYQTLSEKVGISKSTLQRYETGYIKNMPVDKLEEIANALEISPLYLMGWEEKEISQMSRVKERIFGAVTIMSEKDAEKIWELIQATFVLGNAEEVPAEPEEIETLNPYQNGNPEYQPRYTHEEMLRELGLEK